MAATPRPYSAAFGFGTSAAVPTQGPPSLVSRITIAYPCDVLVMWYRISHHGQHTPFSGVARLGIVHAAVASFWHHTGYYLASH